MTKKPKKQKKTTKKETESKKLGKRIINELEEEKKVIKEKSNEKDIKNDLIDIEKLSLIDFSLIRSDTSQASNFRLSDSLLRETVSSRGLILEETIEEEMPTTPTSSGDFYNVGSDPPVTYGEKSDAYTPVEESSGSSPDLGGYMSSTKNNYDITQREAEGRTVTGDIYESGKVNEDKVGEIRVNMFKNNLESAATKKKKKNPFDTSF